MSRSTSLLAEPVGVGNSNLPSMLPPILPLDLPNGRSPTTAIRKTVGWNGTTPCAIGSPCVSCREETLVAPAMKRLLLVLVFGVMGCAIGKQDELFPAFAPTGWSYIRASSDSLEELQAEGCRIKQERRGTLVLCPERP